jgi:hypothetical protein
VLAAALSIMSSSSDRSNDSGVLLPSTCSEAAAPFNRSLSDITDEDFELLVAQRVTSGTFSSWFVAVVVVYFDALEGQKVPMRQQQPARSQFAVGQSPCPGRGPVPEN